MSGRTPRRRSAPVGGGDAALDLVEGEQGAVFVRYLAHALEISIIGGDNASVHHDRLEDHPPPAHDARQ